MRSGDDAAVEAEWRAAREALAAEFRGKRREALRHRRMGPPHRNKAKRHRTG